MLWKWVQTLPRVPGIVVWVLFLPIMVGLWTWESTRPVLGRLVGFASILAWTLLAGYSFIRDFRLR